MRIGETEISAAGASARPYIIAEIGVNHDGDAARAIELTDAAASAGADAIKLQHFRTGLLMSRAARLAAYQAAAGESDPIVMLRRLELPPESMARIVERAHSRGIHAIVTVFSLPLIPDAESIPFDAYKTASPDIIHGPLLGALAATGKPLIVSTGASEYDEIVRARSWLEPARERIAFLHCVSAYPTAPENAHLRAIESVAKAASGAPVGYSDHTQLAETGAAACALGARILEKHLTYDTRAAGPDHAASLDPEGFMSYIRLARAGMHPEVIDARLLGDPTKCVLDCEHDVRAVSRQSITAARPLRRGDVIGADDLCVKRPGTGIEPFHLESVIGRRLARAVDADTPLAWEDLA